MEMKQKGFWAGILASMLVFGLGFVSCGGDDDDGGGGLNLGNITEETTARESIVVADVSLDGMTDGTYTSDSYESFSEGKFFCTVTGGKLSLTLGTPQDDWLGSVSDINDDINDRFFGPTSENPLAISPEDSTAKYCTVSGFSRQSGTTYYGISRDAGAGGATYYDSSSITYVYVNTDVTLTREAMSFTDGGGANVSWAAINLPLKAGWNLVQNDSHETETSVTCTVKIATKDVPWAGGSWEEND
jgi:hypothetical protein